MNLKHCFGLILVSALVLISFLKRITYALCVHTHGHTSKYMPKKVCTKISQGNMIFAFIF
jgi:hypothetical protein